MQGVHAKKREEEGERRGKDMKGKEGKKTRCRSPKHSSNPASIRTALISKAQKNTTHCLCVVIWCTAISMAYCKSRDPDR